MALKKKEEIYENENSTSSRARQLFSSDSSKKKETKILTTFSIEPSRKKELEDLFNQLGLSWAGGIRFALNEFLKNHMDN